MTPSHPWPGGLENVANCPACGDSRRCVELDAVRDEAFAAAPGTWTLQRCLNCRSVYLDPRPDRASLHLAYQDYYTHTPEAGTEGQLARLHKAFSNGYRNRVFATNRRPSSFLGAVLMPLFPQRAASIRREDRGLGRPTQGTRHVLDVGCGNGQFPVWAGELGWQSYGVEIDAVAAEVARSQGVTILGARLEDLPCEYDGTFDAITLSHVIEHVYEPVETLRECHRLLRPGGCLWLETPNIESFGYELYGAHWRGLEAPRHLVLFHFEALRTCLERAGFERIERLPPADVTVPIFFLSAAMRLGRVGERDNTPLPPDIQRGTAVVAREARRRTQREPARAEFITLVASRADISLGR